MVQYVPMQHMTPLRTQILEIVSAQHLISAKELLAVLEKNGQSVNKTTVYRALEYLSGEGKLLKVQFAGMDLMFESTHNLHDHLFCTNCHTIEKVKTSAEQTTRMGSFQVKNRQTIYYGLCKKCAPKGEKRTFSSITSLMGLRSLQ
jgi:Fe2+ or Zn2+ uptake regulation protein